MEETIKEFRGIMKEEERAEIWVLTTDCPFPLELYKSYLIYDIIGYNDILRWRREMEGRFHSKC